MADGEEETPSETQKSPPAQEQPPPSSPATVYPDWASLQAYYTAAGATPIPPPGYFPSPITSSPQGHPYMWSPQIIPPYGTPPPAYVMYPPGMYPHPTVALGTHPYNPYVVASTNGTTESSVAAASGIDADGKSRKERSPLKRSRGSLGSLNALNSKANECGKVSGNGNVSRSGDSGTEGSSEATEGSSQNGSQQKHEDGHGSRGADESQNGNATVSKSNDTAQSPTLIAQTVPLMAMPQGSVSGPTTTLNIGMDYRGSTPATAMPAVRAKLPAVVSPSSTGPREGVPPDLWVQDERELKRERRKQSNRESARRSRLRKQAECEELARRVVTLKEENDTLQQELGRVKEECQRLASENASLTERLENNHGDNPRANSKGSTDDRPDCNSAIAEITDDKLTDPMMQA